MKAALIRTNKPLQFVAIVAGLALAGIFTGGRAATTPAEQGKQFFKQSCSNCHGQNGQGVPHLGADLQTSKRVAKSTNAQLAALIERGIPASDPQNTSHVPMPPKGANPAMTAQDVRDIVLYLRHLQKARGK